MTAESVPQAAQDIDRQAGLKTRSCGPETAPAMGRRGSKGRFPSENRCIDVGKLRFSL
jgi:hypothetical protein